VFEAIPLEVFQARTGIVSKDFLFTPEVAEIVSLRSISSVSQVHIMPIPYLKKLLLNISTVGDANCRVYRGCKMKRVKIDPLQVRIGQTFVERQKCLKILEEFPGTFSGFDVPSGFTNHPSLIVIGKTGTDSVAIAHYLPPIIEIRKGGRNPKILDGIHRSFLTQAVGTTIETVMFYDVAVPFPCETRDWEDISLVDAKPPKEKRFFDLKPEYFRDLKQVGVDG